MLHPESPGWKGARLRRACRYGNHASHRLLIGAVVIRLVLLVSKGINGSGRISEQAGGGGRPCGCAGPDRRLDIVVRRIGLTRRRGHCPARSGTCVDGPVECGCATSTGRMKPMCASEGRVDARGGTVGEAVILKMQGCGDIRDSVQKLLQDPVFAGSRNTETRWIRPGR